MENKNEEDEVKKTTLRIMESIANRNASINKINAERDENIAKTKDVLNQFIEESDKIKAKKEKQLDLMNGRLQSAAQGNDPNALFAEMDKLTAMMDSYSDDEVIQAVKDKQLKDAKID